MYFYEKALLMRKNDAFVRGDRRCRTHARTHEKLESLFLMRQKLGAIKGLQLFFRA